MRDGWNSAQWNSVLWESLQRQRETAEELKAWRAQGADVVVLHRGSCSQISDLNMVTCETGFCQEIRHAQDAGTVLYGDDLAPAGQWMLDNLDVAARPRIFMAGAYADRAHGCLTAVGRILETAARGRIEVSAWSPAPSGERWIPEPPKADMGMKL